MVILCAFRANQVYAYSSLYALTSCPHFMPLDNVLRTQFQYSSFFCFIFIAPSFLLHLFAPSFWLHLFYFIFFAPSFSFAPPFRICCFIINMLRADPDRFLQFPSRDRFFFPTCILYFPLENLFLPLPNYFAFYLTIATFLFIVE